MVRDTQIFDKLLKTADFRTSEKAVCLLQHQPPETAVTEIISACFIVYNYKQQHLPYWERICRNPNKNIRWL